MAIDLDFDEQQQLIQNTAREFFGEHCESSVVRRYEQRDGTEEFPRHIWDKMAELGWLGITFPEAYGGLNCSFLDLFSLYIEIGRSLAPVPHLETVALAGSLIADLGTDEQKRTFLPPLIEGKLILSLALSEPDRSHGPDGVTVEARQIGDEFVVNGVKALVANARSANRLVCAVRTRGQSGSDGISLLLVDPLAAGVLVEPVDNIAGLPLYMVTFDNVKVPKADLLGEPDSVWSAVDAVLMKACVLQAAMVWGAGDHILETSVEYANSRKQFGVPVGRYQAVQYLATDIAFERDSTRLLALQAAWRINSGMDFLREAALAKAAASRAAAVMTAAAHEIHAGIAFMGDYDLQLYTRRAKYWETHLGDARYHFERAIAEGEARTNPDFSADALSIL